MALLVIEDLYVNYGHIAALKGINLQVAEGEIVTLLGANGAGKSTTLRAISSLIKPKQGRIIFRGQDLQRVPAHDIVRIGIAHAPEGRRVFATLSVAENLLLGGYWRRRDRRGIQETLSKVYEFFPRLAERRHQLAGTLSGGEQQMLAIGRALMADPKLLMLDEPSLGLAPLLVQNIFRVIREINQLGVTVLLVEQNVRAALRLADRGSVLETGRVVLSGTAKELAQDERVRKSYLGEQ
ncbi:MAG TPA: ABC transporter ATP-binding protein [Firmicutes bacterium]|jgi:branched-chain amino acid transport system ATP-binding protein|nr:ABC transporter ATP-binding protein [Bacillota bacterium]